MYITLLLLHNYYEECVALVLNLPNMVSLLKKCFDINFTWNTHFYAKVQSNFSYLGSVRPKSVHKTEIPVT